MFGEQEVLRPHKSQREIAGRILNACLGPASKTVIHAREIMMSSETKEGDSPNGSFKGSGENTATVGSWT